MEFDFSELSERKRQILKAIVEAHIKLGEPVGSKYLTDQIGIQYSSATIRNEMAELEELGFLEKPHTSAGRIPSELGYRFYVDSLVDQYDMSTKEADQLSSMLNAKKSEIDKILEKASKVASAFTNYTALTLRPKPSGVAIKKFEVVYIDSKSFLLVMIAEGDVVKTKNVTVPFAISSADCTKLTAILNENIAEKKLDEINISLMMQMEEKFSEKNEFLSIAIKNIYETMNELGQEIKFEGVNHLLQYPEYKDLDKFKQMLTTIENKEDILKAVSEIDESDGETKIFIGSENAVKIMEDSTLIYKNLKLNGKTIGAIGIIGPCRMDYSKVLATIDKLSDEINNLSELPLMIGNDDKKTR